MYWKKECLNCDLTLRCNHIKKANKGWSGTGDITCDDWAGWVPASCCQPEVDEYVLIQLTEEYAGEENITIGMFFPEDTVENPTPQWYTGHIGLNPIESKYVYAWRPLPKPMKET